LNAVLLPLLLAGVGIITSIIGTFFVKVKEGGDPQKALNRGEFLSAALMLAATFLIVTWILPDTWTFGEITQLGCILGRDLRFGRWLADRNDH
jgi:K(+)-stimulated pyrophosphate-energized sodium pump